MDLNFAFRLQVLGIKLNFLLLLLSVRLDEERITKIVIVQVKGSLVIPVSIGLYDLTVGNLGILHHDIGVSTSLSIRTTDKTFDSEPMVGLVRRHGYERRKHESRRKHCNPS